MEKRKVEKVDAGLLAEIQLQAVLDKHPTRKLRASRVEGDPYRFRLTFRGLTLAEGTVEAFAELVVGYVADAIELEASKALQELHGHTYRRNVIPAVKSMTATETGSARNLLLTPELVATVAAAWQDRKEFENGCERGDQAYQGGATQEGA